MLHDGIPGSRLVFVNGANHVLIWTHSDEVLRVTEEFLGPDRAWWFGDSARRTSQAAMSRRLSANPAAAGPSGGVPGTGAGEPLHKILLQGELRPHKVRYYVERRDPEFESKMAAVLHVYKEVEILNKGLLRGEIREPGTVTVSYDEKPGIQALAQKTPDRPPLPGQHASPTRDYEYQRRGTVSLLRSITLGHSPTPCASDLLLCVSLTISVTVPMI